MIEQFRGQSLDAHYLGYFECFNQGLFFESHDVLEELWLAQGRGPNYAFYKGLIQLAGAFVHLQKNRLRPAAALFRLAQTNLTPYGTMIVVPSYWSFDAKRDLKWKSIKALHRTRCVSRQGMKLEAIKQARREDSKRVKQLWQKAKSCGLKGDARIRWVMKEMGWAMASDESKVKRLLRLK